MEKESKSVRLEKEDAMNRARYIRPPPFMGVNPDQNWIDGDDDDDYYY